jgi:hypothetical protein
MLNIIAEAGLLELPEPHCVAAPAPQQWLK